MDWFKLFSEVIGGLGIFLLGMKYMSEGLQAVSGDRLRKIIGAVTNNRVMGVVIGLLVTCIVQSSSVTTVMVVGFVNSGIMTLMQAIGVIFGANIGTTITGWILVLKIGKYGLPMLAIAAFFFLFSKRERLRYVGMTIMGIGMVFFGLELMKNGFKPLRHAEGFETAFHAFQATTYLGIIKCAAVGCIMTMIVQSSSATLGITIGLASTGVIEFQTAAALVMGENIGTTITALLASLGANTTARRAAYAHVLFNVFGTSWFIALFPVAIKALSGLIAHQTGYNPLTIDVNDMSPDKFGQIITAGIALTHTSFNVVNTFMFLPFAGLLAKLVTKLVPEKAAIAETGRLTYFDVRMVESPALGIVQSHGQLTAMTDTLSKTMRLLRKRLTGNGNETDERVVFRNEEVLDNIQKEIFLFLNGMVASEVSHDVAARAYMHMRVADELESIGDYAANALKGLKKLEQNRLELKGSSKEGLLELHDRVAQYLARIADFVKREEADILFANSEGAAITDLMKTLRREHLERLQNKEEELSPFFSLTYTDMLNFYRRMKDHALNIAEVVAGEK